MLNAVECSVNFVEADGPSMYGMQMVDLGILHLTFCLHAESRGHQ